MRLRARPSPVGGPRPGVNLAGYFDAELGVGELGRLLAESVRAAGMPYVSRINPHVRSQRGAPFVEEGEALHPVTVAAVNADQLPGWLEHAPELHRGRVLVGLWAWEVDRFREYARSFRAVDEVWTISEHARAAIQARTDKPVHVFPVPTRVPPPGRGDLPAPAGGRPYVLFAFDHLSSIERKNPLGLVTAFRRAFPNGDGPALVVKAINGHLAPLAQARLRAAVADRDDLVLLEDYLSAEQVGALMDGCTAYASLHRAEGFGLTLAEAMVRGRPVIATGDSGNLDFMDDSTALLVPSRRVRIGRGEPPYPHSATWAEPDLDAAAAHLRWVVEHPAQARLLGARARAHHLEHRSTARAAAFVRERVVALTPAAPRRAS